MNIINSAIVFDSNTDIEVFCGHLTKSFEFTRTNVEGLKGMFEGIEGKFKKSIMNWVRRWISNRSKSYQWDLTPYKFKRLAGFAPDDQLLSGETFRDLLNTGNFNKPDDVKYLLETFSGNQPEGAPHEEIISAIKTWLDFTKKKYQDHNWDRDPLLNSFFFPAMCPKLCGKLNEDDYTELHEYIKGVNNKNKYAFLPFY